MGGPQLIREALELLTRPLRRKWWRRRRERRIKAHERWGELQDKLNVRQFNPLETDEDICFFPPGAIPCTWEERDHADIKKDVHRWVEKKLRRWNRSHSKAEAFLRRVKKDLKKKKFVGVDHGPDWVNPLANDEDGGLDRTWDPMAIDDTPCGPAFWDVPKEIRDEQRRDKLKQALRRKVPKAWEDV